MVTARPSGHEVGTLLCGPIEPAQRFLQLTGERPDGVWRAPGRVNLIGEHTDYNAGLALPFAIDRYTDVAVRRRRDRLVRCWSAADPGWVELDLDDLSATGWARYPAGVLWAMGRAQVTVPGLDLVVESSLPLGGGLSSSAALEAAVAVAVSDLAGVDLDRRALVELCHAAEAEFVGVPVGSLDQFAVLCGRAGHGLMIDFRSSEIADVALRADPVVVVNTNVRHRNADGSYAARRRSCDEAAEKLGVTDLRDATMGDVADGLDGELQRRARHVVSENERVLSAVRRLRSGGDIGDLLYASHASLRDDFQVSCPELDAVVETAAELGAPGARLTGSGFGGCAIVLGLGAGELSAAVQDVFSRRGFARPEVFAVQPVAGAGRLL